MLRINMLNNKFRIDDDGHDYPTYEAWVFDSRGFELTVRSNGWVLNYRKVGPWHNRTN